MSEAYRFRSLVNQFIPHYDISEQAMMPKDLLD